MSKVLVFYSENDHSLVVKAKSTDQLTGNDIPLTTANVNYELIKDSDGSALASSVMTFASAVSPDSDGYYIFVAILQDTISVVIGDEYTCKVTLVGDGNTKGTVYLPVEILQRVN